MRANKAGILFKTLSIIILIVNILIFIYDMVLTTRNNIIEVVLFFVLVSISIVTIFIVRNALILAESCWRTFFDVDYMKERSDIKDLLKNGTISKEEAKTRRNEILDIHNNYCDTIRLYHLLFKISIIVFALSILFLSIQQLFSNMDDLLNINYQIYLIITGIISQVLILTFSKITEYVFLKQEIRL